MTTRDYTILYIDRTAIIAGMAQIAFMTVNAESFLKAYHKTMAISTISDRDIRSITVTSRSKPFEQEEEIK